MNDHYGEARDVVNHGKCADTFARYCAGKLDGSERRIKANDTRKLVSKVEILWQGNPLSSVKTFKTIEKSHSKNNVKVNIYIAFYLGRSDQHSL